MSNQQFFGDGGSPSFSGIETVTGDTGGAVPGSGVPVNLNLIGDSAQGTVVNGTPGTSTQQVTILDATAAASAGAAQKGSSSYNDADFTVVNGFVSLKNSPSGDATTNGLETKDLITFTMTPNSVITLEARISGYGTPTGVGVDAGLGGTITATFIAGATTAAQIDVPDIFIQSFVSPTATFTAVAVSGLDIAIQVTGDASYDINWHGDADITEAT